MIEFTNTIHIDKPIEDVFDYVADLENAPQWNHAVVKTTKISPGPIDEGTKFRQYRNEPRHQAETIEIVEYRPGRCLGVEGRLADQPAQLTYRFSEDGVGTLLSNHVALEPQGPLRLLVPLVGSRIETAVANNLDLLKNILEAA
jgi:uncharacterized protein YndB with AHSA1/START domain